MIRITAQCPKCERRGRYLGLLGRDGIDERMGKFKCTYCLITFYVILGKGWYENAKAKEMDD